MQCVTVTQSTPAGGSPQAGPVLSTLAVTQEFDVGSVVVKGLDVRHDSARFLKAGMGAGITHHVYRN